MHERDWLIVVGILVIVAILLDGVRRIRNARRDSLQISINMNRGIDGREMDEFAGDLPVRVIDKRDDSVKRGKPAAETASARAVEPPLSDTARKRQIDFEKTAPLLMDVKDGRQVRIEPGFSSEDDEADEADEAMTDNLDADELDTEELDTEDLDSDLDEVMDDDGDEEDPAVQSELERTNPPVRGVKNASPVFDTATTPLGLGESQVIGGPRVLDRPADMPPPRKEPPVLKPSKPVIKAIEEKAQQPAAQTEKPPVAPKPKPPEDVIVISVMARESSGFPGAAMLEILLTNGLRYGHRNIFHRYTGEEREHDALFSVANAVKPGTFDLLNMESFHTPGITLFLPLPSPGGKAMDAFEAMLTTARQVAEQLNGDLRDDQRSALTGQSIEHCRQRIRDFEMQSRLRAR